MSFLSHLKESKEVIQSDIIEESRGNKNIFSKNKFEKFLISGEHIQTKNGETLWLDSDNNWMLGTDKSTFAILYKKYKEAMSINEVKSAEDLLRSNSIKIKSVHGTKFGTEFVLAKKYDEKEIKDILSDFTLKFDDKSVFVID